MNAHTTDTDLLNNAELEGAQARAVLAGVSNFALKTKADYEPKQREFKVSALYLRNSPSLTTYRIGVMRNGLLME